MTKPDDGDDRWTINAQNALSLVAAAFIGTLNVLGLKDAEVYNLLRNERGYPSIIYGIFLGALILAVLSVFLPKRVVRRRALLVSILLFSAGGISTIVWLPINTYLTTDSRVIAGAATIVLLALSVVAIKTDTLGSSIAAGILFLSGLAALLIDVGSYPAATRLNWLDAPIHMSLKACGGTLCGLGLAVLVFGLAFWREHYKLTARLEAVEIPQQAVLLTCALLLTAIASYSSLRVEARAQVRSGYPQISVNTDSARSVVSVSSARLAAESYIEVSVLGLKRDSKPQSCKDVTLMSEYAESAFSCSVTPCIYRQSPSPVTQTSGNSICDVVSEGYARPEPNGTAKFDIGIAKLGSQYRTLYVAARACNPTINPDSTCEADTEPAKFSDAVVSMGPAS